MMSLPAEVLKPNLRRGPFRAVLFDFDGTISLIREGWPHIMIGMMVDTLRAMRLANEPDEILWTSVDRFVMALNGHPTIVQMARFAEEVSSRGGVADDPKVYLEAYLDRLMRIVRQRWDNLASGRASPDAWVVPSAHALLHDVGNRGLPLFLASGTDRESVLHEGRLLGVLAPFGPHVYAPAHGDATFSKRQVVERILDSLGIRGDELLGFGDGVVETQEVKRVGGVMVGVASNEAGRPGINPEKRDRLAAAGADLIIPDYSQHDSWLRWLFAEV